MVNQIAGEDQSFVESVPLESYQVPEFDCKRRIGQQNYTFYFPIEIANFVIQLWTRDSKAGDGYSEWTKENHGIKLVPGTKDNVKYSLSIYENGSKISLKDSRFRGKLWAHQLLNRWSEEVFTKDGVDNILAELCRLSYPATKREE